MSFQGTFFCLVITLNFAISKPMEQPEQERKEDSFALQVLLESQKKAFIADEGCPFSKALYFAVCKGRLQLATHLITHIYDRCGHRGEDSNEHKKRFAYDVVENPYIKDFKNSYLKATTYGYLSLVKQFLDCGIKVDTRFEGGTTALIIAADHGHEEIIQLLLQRNANVNVISKNGGTALSCAINNNYPRIVKKLLAAKANPNAQIIFDCKKVKLLGWCCGRSDRNHFIAKLIKAGADPDGMDTHEDLPLMSAIQSDNNEAIVDLVHAGANINKMNNMGLTALMFAALKNKYCSMHYLLGCNANPEVQTKNSNTALILAAYKGHYESVKILMEGVAYPMSMQFFDELSKINTNYFSYLPPEIRGLLVSFYRLGRANVSHKNACGVDALYAACEGEKKEKNEEKLKVYEKIIALLKKHCPIEPQ